MDTPQLSPIDINKPKNSFETRMVKAYNDCRYKYLGVLSDQEMGVLVQDNYRCETDFQ